MCEEKGGGTVKKTERDVFLKEENYKKNCDFNRIG